MPWSIRLTIISGLVSLLRILDIIRERVALSTMSATALFPGHLGRSWYETFLYREVG
jgi:hypothetical protein